MSLISSIETALLYCLRWSPVFFQVIHDDFCSQPTLPPRSLHPGQHHQLHGHVRRPPGTTVVCCCQTGNGWPLDSVIPVYVQGIVISLQYCILFVFFTLCYFCMKTLKISRFHSSFYYHFDLLYIIQIDRDKKRYIFLYKVFLWLKKTF